MNKVLALTKSHGNEQKLKAIRIRHVIEDEGEEEVVA